MKKLLALLVIISNYAFAQVGDIGYVEDYFKLNAHQLDSVITDLGFVTKSKNSKSGTFTYGKEDGLYQYSIIATFEKGKLKSYLWNDKIRTASYTVTTIQSHGYIVSEENTNDALGIFYYRSTDQNLDVIIFKTRANMQKGMIAFHLFKRPKK